MSLPDTTVKFYIDAMSGAADLTGTAGALITLLDACLVDGFGSVTLNSLSVSSDVATATVNAGHNFVMIGDAGPVIKIAGATPSGLNGEWRIASIPGTNTFTFATSGISNQTATGTITAKRAPAGFTKVYSGTNKAVYRADSITGNRFYLRVDDSQALYAGVISYETMSGVDTGTKPMPTSSTLYLPKSSNSGERWWRLIADHQSFYLFVDAYNYSNTYFNQSMFFGDIVKSSSTDSYGTSLIANTSSAYNANSGMLHTLGATAAGSYLQRSYSQTGVAVASGRHSHYSPTSNGALGGSMAAGMSVCPNPADGLIHIWPVTVIESLNYFYRGKMPGFYAPIFNTTATSFPIDTATFNYGSRVFWSQAMVGQYRAFIDIIGPWR